MWTLVAAPIALFAVRAAGLTIAAGGPVRPVFDPRGIGHHARFGAVLALGQLFWFAQSQADVLIAGRHLAAHELGLYTTALFLTQIFVAKVVPPLNEVALSVYAQLGADRDATAAAFAKSVRVIFAAAMPFSLGLAATAEPLVVTVLGGKWAEAAPLVRLLALAMPMMTLLVSTRPPATRLAGPTWASATARSAGRCSPGGSSSGCIGARRGSPSPGWAPTRSTCSPRRRARCR